MRKILTALMDSFHAQIGGPERPRSRQPILVRDFIHECLYGSSNGYFQLPNNSHTLMTADIALDFPSLRTQSDYNRQICQLVRSGWPTPSTLWQPWYARILEKHIPFKPIIYEIGPGRASLARNLLQNSKEIQEYHLVEISKPLHQHQKEVMKSFTKAHCHLGTIDDHQMRDERPCTILMTEVLDNVPHDLVRVEPNGLLSQGYVVYNEKARFGDIPGKLYYEFVSNVQDPWIRQCVRFIQDSCDHLQSSTLENLLKWCRLDHIMVEYIYPRSCYFIPTGTFKMLSTMAKRFPKANLVIIDFDSLPDSLPYMHNSPVVQAIYSPQVIKEHLSLTTTTTTNDDNQQKQGEDEEDTESIALDTLLVKPGLCDIFFPINFQLLNKMVKYFWPQSHVQIGKHNTSLMSSAESEILKATTCQSGFNPLLHTFGNLSYLISTNSL